MGQMKDMALYIEENRAAIKAAREFSTRPPDEREESIALAAISILIEDAVRHLDKKPTDIEKSNATAAVFYWVKGWNAGREALQAAERASGLPA